MTEPVVTPEPPDLDVALLTRVMKSLDSRLLEGEAEAYALLVAERYAALAPFLDTPTPREVKVAEVRVWDPARRAMRIVCRCGKEILVGNWARHLSAPGNHGLQYATPLPRDPAVQRLVDAARALLAFKGNAPGMDTCSDHSGCAVPNLREALRHLEQEAGG